MANFGNSKTAITLTASSDTFTGTIDATGPAGAYNFYGASQILHAAIFGPKSKHFTLDNTGTILSRGTATSDFGIVLDAPGTIKNAGHIEAEGGILIAGPGPAVIDNTGKIIATNFIDPALYLAGGGTVTNATTGTIQSAGVGVSLKKSGTVTNAGTIIGANAAISAEGNTKIVNSGRLQGNEAIDATALLNLTNTGTIIGTGSSALFLTDGATILNSGHIDGEIYEFEGTADINNEKGATITASDQALSLYGASIDNAGTIQGSDGIFIGESGGIVSNASTGLISAASYAVLAQGGTIINAGKIIAHAGPGDNNPFFDGAVDATTVTNTKTGTITDTAGIGVSAATLNNAGLITAAEAVAASAITNTGTIIGRTIAISLASAATIDNSGIITGAVDAAAYALITNTGTIGALTLAAGGTVTNAGSIASIDFASHTAVNHLIIDTGATFGASPNLNGGTVEFAASNTLSNNEFTNNGWLTIDQGATIAISGAVTEAASIEVLNNGMITLGSQSALTLEGPYGGAGTIDIGAKPLTLNGAATGTIAFTGTAETLNLADPAEIASTLKNFAPGDTIDLTGIAKSEIKSTHFANGILTLSLANASNIQLAFASPDLASDTFALTAHAASTYITLAPKPAIQSPTAATQTTFPSTQPAPTTTTTPPPAPSVTISPPTGIAATLLHPTNDLVIACAAKQSILRATAETGFK
jgi:hypothetical protein